MKNALKTALIFGSITITCMFGSCYGRYQFIKSQEASERLRAIALSQNYIPLTQQQYSQALWIELVNVSAFGAIPASLLSLLLIRIKSKEVESALAIEQSRLSKLLTDPSVSGIDKGAILDVIGLLESRKNEV